MAINLRANRRGRIIVTGDLSADLRIPVDGIEDRFWINMSDGSRLLATPDHDGAYGFRLVDEGAALIRIDDDRVQVGWDVEWVALSGYYESAQRPPAHLRSLPLLDLIMS